MRDLVISKKDTSSITLSEFGIETLTIDESFPIASVNSRESSSLGFTSHYGRLVEKTIKAKLTFLAKDKFEYYDKELLVFSTFSYSKEQTLSLYESLSSGYEFEKPTSYRDYYTSRKLIKRWDVVITKEPSLVRDGLRCFIDVEFTTSYVPFSYTEDVVLDLVNSDFVGVPHRETLINYKGSKSLDNSKLYPKIKLSGVSANEGFILEANGTQMIVKSPMVATQSFIYDGYSYTIGGLGVSRKTNYEGLKLIRGRNNVKLRPVGDFTEFNVKLRLEFRDYNY